MALNAIGVVMAGGESRRFGSRKALASFLEEPLVRRAARLLEESCAQVVVSTSDPEVGSAASRPTVPDRVPGRGPLGGLHAALHLAREEGVDGVFLLACDMPLVTGDVVRELLARAASEAAPSVVPSLGENHLEPLCGWYGIECLPAVEEALAEDDVSLHGLHQRLGGLGVPVAKLGVTGEGAEVLRGANTPTELADLEVIARRDASPPLPPVICVVGFKDTGKTGVAVGLVEELKRRGHRVAAVKHGHRFRLDTPGTDSWRLRHEGGADPVLLAGPEGFALMGGWGEEGEQDLEELVRRHLSEADVVVAEGFKRSRFPRVEVYRHGLHPTPVFQAGAPDAELFLALVTDQELPGLPVRQFSAGDPLLFEALADLVEGRLFGARLPRTPEG
ncbi:MAG: molybdopterin-guanine dinucleotide biosynthesis protein B [Gemmatimonadota bacterium]